jgi:uncharacterized FlgJ-related protein
MNYAVIKSNKKHFNYKQLLSLILFYLILTTSFYVGKSKSKPIVVYCDSCNYYSKTILNWENIDYWLDYFKVQQKEIVKAQIMLESNNLSSKIALQNNNLFGMKFPSVRETSASHKENSHAAYPNYIESIKDYSIYQYSYYRGGDYYKFLLKAKYATDSTYINKLKKIQHGRIG